MRTINQNFKHLARHEKGTQDPIETLRLGSGSCRDLAVLMIGTALTWNRGAVRFWLSES